MEGQCSLECSSKYIVFPMLLWFLNTEEPSVTHPSDSEYQRTCDLYCHGQMVSNPQFWESELCVKVNSDPLPYSGLQGGY